ncbi:unnamed protein product [Linum tenue]|uniref:F-box domain-containing protein n=1 Tax=Linum tenue TaxID=586396 RepID=A0AAV0JF78_9ROSI|nr:unnamed protein product [Linum tenue]
MRWSSSSCGEECPPFEFGRVRSFGRKRIVISQNLACCWDSEMSPRTPLKRLCSEPLALGAVMAEIDEQRTEEKSVLASLPQDILIKVLCGVNHEDLKQLLLVSKPISEATSIAKESHFAYSTPTKVRAFRSPTIDYDSEIDEIEAPGAPNRAARRLPKPPRLSDKEVSDLSVALFSDASSPPKRKKKGLFMDMEM